MKKKGRDREPNLHALLTAFRCAQKQKIYSNWSRRARLRQKDGVAHCYCSSREPWSQLWPSVLIEVLWHFSISPVSHLGILANLFQAPESLCWEGWKGVMVQLLGRAQSECAGVMVQYPLGLFHPPVSGWSCVYMCTCVPLQCFERECC